MVFSLFFLIICLMHCKDLSYIHPISGKMRTGIYIREKVCMQKNKSANHRQVDAINE